MAIHTMTFRDFMEWSLLDPEIGYYTHRAKIGLTGSDFVTAPEVSPIFSLLIAEQMIELDRYLGSPEKFYLIETGPGNGTLMRSILTYMKLIEPQLFERVHPVMLEASPFLRQTQEKQLSGLMLKNPPLWMDVQTFSLSKIEGVIFGNEFLDALPAHWVSRSNGELMEIHVEIEKNGVVKKIKKPLSNPDIKKYFEWLGVDLPEGCESEISLDAISILEKLDSIMDRGFMLWIDYGDSSAEKYSKRRNRGTLRGFKGHQLIDQVLDHPPGSIDLTAHVDFTGVLKRLLELGHRLEGYSDQMSYLIAMGVERVLEENPLSETEARAATTLIHPLQMGRIFKVLLTSKGVVHKERLKGFPREALLPLFHSDHEC
ncbi:MAG: class I SAM-dependent methyltransferase [Leptospirillum sp.]